MLVGPKCVNETLEGVTSIDPNTHINKLTASRTRHLIGYIIRDNCRRTELLYDIILQERLNCDLDYLDFFFTY